MKMSIPSFANRLLLLAACLAFSATIVVPYAAFAATPTGGSQQSTTPNPAVGQALEIAPPILTLSASPGEVIKTELNLRNVSSGNLIVGAQVNDFVAAGEDGTPKLLMEESDTPNPYSLKDWVRPITSGLMVPKQLKKIPVTIAVPANASPGGHYGIIRFTATPPELEGTGVALSASLGSLVLLTVKGDVTEKLEVEEFAVMTMDKEKKGLFESTPLLFMQRIKNTGNIHELPVGQVIISDMFGKKVAGMNVNLPPRNILPASIRKFEQPLDSSVIGNKKLFGRYTAELKLTYGATNQVLTDSITFWVIPYRLIAGAVILLVGGFFVLRYLIRDYNRRIINKAQGTTTKRRK